jgi:Ecdysteroid kinase-like family
MREAAGGGGGGGTAPTGAIVGPAGGGGGGAGTAAGGSGGVGVTPQRYGTQPLVVRYLAMGDITFPSAVDDFTPEYLTGLLRSAGHLPNGVVANVRHEPVGEGVGIVGQLVRLRVTYDGDAGDLPDSMVAKFPSPYPQTKDIAQFYGFYRTEVECYRQAVADGLGVRTPRMLVAEVSDDDRDTVLILDDLSALRMADQVQGASLADAETLMDAAAALHARWWNSPRLADLEWLRPVNNPAYKASQQQYQLVWPMFVERYGDTVTPGSLAIGERHGAQIADYYDWVSKSRPLTLVHTDFRLDNFFFDDSAGDADRRVVIIDWQLSVQSFGAQDVSYFLVQSMSVDDRQAHGERLLRRWHDALLAGGVADYSWDDALTDFRRCVLTQLPIGVIGPASMEPGNERGRALLDAIATRNFQALVDYDCAALHLP